MSQQDLVSRLIRRLGVSGVRGSQSEGQHHEPATLSAKAGRASDPMADAFQALEPRILLSGDHPGLDEVFDDVSPVAPTVITIDGNGRGEDTGVIGDVSPETGDFFQFTAASDGFVSILADADDPDTLDTRLELYSPDGTRLSGANEGLNNGNLARGFDSDGWLGFIAEAGETYYIRVMGENFTSGSYNVEINTRNNTLSVDPATGFARTGSDGIDSFERIDEDERQQDQIFTFTTPDSEEFDSIGSVLAGTIAFDDDGNGYVLDPAADRNLLDTRVELYDAAGNLIGADSSSGHESDGFLVTRFERDTTYYVRVRSDASEETFVTDPQTGMNDDVSFGTFELRVQAKATDFDLDPVTRLGERFRDPTNPDDTFEVEFLRDQHSAQLFEFTALGSGPTIITFTTFEEINPQLRIPGWDPKLTLYGDDSLNPIAENDNALQFDAFGRAEITVNLQGGETYYVLVDAFDGPILNVTDDAVDIAASEQYYQFVIESNATIDSSDPDQPIDDHVNFFADDTSTVRDLATPLVWGDPFKPFAWIDDNDWADTNGDGNPDVYGFPGPFGPSPRYLSVFDFPNQANDHSEVVLAAASGRLHTNADTDVFMFVPQVDHLGRFEGGLEKDMDGNVIEPNVWLENGRPASRVSISVVFELEWLQTGTVAVQVYDSNFNLVNEELMDPLQSVNTDTGGPAGLESPSLLSPNPTDYRKEEVAVTLDNEYWGGEAYYIVISAPGSRTRYDLLVQADAFEDTFADNSEAPEEGNFGDPEELFLDLFSGVGTTIGNPNFSTDIRTFGSVDTGLDPVDDIGSYFDLITQTGQLGIIHDYSDTDVYRFTAPKTGTAEILISTTQIMDQFNEVFFDMANGILVNNRTITKTYDSPLDAAIRVFDGAGNQVAYVDDFLGYDAGGSTINFGTSGNPNVGDTLVFRKDPRVVLDVLSGQEYFIVVESSQRYSDNAGAANQSSRVDSDPSNGDVDWRVATGSYKLIVNTTPNINSGDDHANGFFGFRPTVIGIDADPDSPTVGTGSITGTIETTTDADTFEFVATRDGLLTLTIDPSAGLSIEILILDGNGDVVTIPNSTAIGGEPLTTSFVVLQSERYSLRVGSLNGTGTYDISLSGLPVADDIANQSQFAQAQEITFADVGRSASAEGIINQGGDSDIFFFDANTTDLATLTVSRQFGQTAMAPAVIVYELGQDAAMPANAVNHVISWDLNPNENGTVTLDFSTQQGRRYFVVVRGANPEDSVGGYDLTIDYNPEDDHADIGELLEATFINVVPSTGAGSETGILEQSNDSDLFVFGVPANGPVDISLVWDPEPGATFELRIYDIDGNVFDVDGDMMPDTYTSASGFLSIDQFNAETADIFYVAVLGPTASRINYTISVNTGLIDDHANDGDFDTATVIPLDLDTGDGDATGRLETDDDTDFYTFDVLDDGLVTIDFSTGTIATPVFKLYDADENLISFTQVDADTIQFTNANGAFATYYLSIGSTFPGVRTGTYAVSVDGPPVAPSPGDDHANIGDLAGATILAVNTISGDARDTGVIDTITDTDLFRYETIGRGEVFINVVTPDSPTPDFTVRIFDSAGNEIVDLADADGVQGASGVTASTSFTASGPGQVFYILVDSTNNVDTGNYTLRVDGPAITSKTYYPEGFANANIHEFVSLANPNDESVSYTITVYYADAGLGSAVVASGVLAAGARGGATLSYGADIDNDGMADFAPGIIANEAYAIVVDSTLRLGASLSHYDNNLATNGAIGEAFSDLTANRWDFPDVSRNPGVTEEFLVYYNPNPFEVDITITAYTGSGSTVVLPSVTVGANRRGGIEVHNTGAFPLGTFAIEITSTPTDSANGPFDLGIIAGISRYNLVDKFAFGYLGIRDGGSTTNIITSITNGTDVTGEFSIFNASGTDAVVDIRGTYLEDPGLPDLVRQVTVGAGERLRLTGNDLAFVNNETLGLTITSNVEVAISSIERQRGDADATGAFTEAGESFYFGDAFMNPLRAGDLYTESLAFYNPNDDDTSVEITFYFADGTSERMRTELIGGNEFLLLRLENLSEVVQSRPVLNYYAMRIDASAAVVVEMTHYDGFLGGGWSTGGAVLGLQNSIA